MEVLSIKFNGIVYEDGENVANKFFPHGEFTDQPTVSGLLRITERLLTVCNTPLAVNFNSPLFIGKLTH